MICFIQSYVVKVDFLVDVNVSGHTMMISFSRHVMKVRLFKISCVITLRCTVILEVTITGCFQERPQREETAHDIYIYIWRGMKNYFCFPQIFRQLIFAKSFKVKYCQWLALPSLADWIVLVFPDYLRLPCALVFYTFPPRLCVTMICQVHLLGISQLTEGGKHGALSLARCVRRREVHLVLSVWRSQVKHSGCFCYNPTQRLFRSLST